MLNILGDIVITLAFICFGIYKYFKGSCSLSGLIGACLIIASMFSYSAIHYLLNNENTLVIRYLMALIGAFCEANQIKILKDQVKSLKKIISNYSD